MAKTGARVALLGGTAMLFTGCVKMDFATELNEDGSGTFGISSSVNTEEMMDEDYSEMLIMGGDPDAFLDEMDASEVPGNVSVDHREEDGWVTDELMINFDNMNNFDASFFEETETSEEEMIVPLGDKPMFQVAEDGGVVSFQFSSEVDEAEASEMEMLSEFMDVNYTLILPNEAELVDHNADQVSEEGNVLTWELGVMTEDVDVQAAYELDTGGDNLNTMLSIAGIAAISGLALVAVKRKRDMQ